jgi:hypothetical protein
MAGMPGDLRLDLLETKPMQPSGADKLVLGVPPIGQGSCRAALQVPNSASILHLLLRHVYHFQVVPEPICLPALKTNNATQPGTR